METTDYFCSKHKRMRKVVFGLLLIASGALLLGFNAGLLDPTYKSIIFSWPTLLIAIGFMNLFGREHAFSGLILISVGAFFLLPRIILLPNNFEYSFWPSLLILIGIFIIIRRVLFPKRFERYQQERFERFHNKHFYKYATNDMQDEAGYIFMKNVFGGGKHQVPPSEFKGGKISNVFGGVELDLSQTTLAVGRNVLEIECVFGGASILVPADWVVHIEMTSVAGGFVDKRHSTKNGSSDRELIIKGSAVFGGGEIKSI